MSMKKQTFSITDQHSVWLKSQVASGQFGSASEVIRDMIRERQSREFETPEQIEWLRHKLAKSRASGISDTNPEDLLAKIKAELK